MSKTLTIVLTAVIAFGSIAWGIAAGLGKDQWLIMLQSLGTILALLWVIHTVWLQERTGSRDVMLQSLDLIKADLEDLTKSIETELAALGSKADQYERRFREWERTAYTVPLTAKHGRRLRGLWASKKDRSPKLERRLKTYISMFQPIISMSKSDPEFRQIIEASPHGRVYLAINAALATDDSVAKTFSEKLAAHDTGIAEDD